MFFFPLAPSSSHFVLAVNLVTNVFIVTEIQKRYEDISVLGQRPAE